MRVNRRFLYAGVFLVAVGGILVAADLGLLDTAGLTDTLRLWPLAAVAVGAGLVLRRTRAGLSSGMLAAAVPGLLLGGALAVAPRWAGDCGARGEPASVATERGTFDGPARVSVTSGCGSITVTTVPGKDWELDAANTEGRTPAVVASARSLAVDSGGHEAWDFIGGGRDTRDLTLPASDIEQLSLVVNAGRGEVRLPGAEIGRLALTANASRITVDASDAALGDLSAVVRAGSISLDVPSGADLDGSVRIAAGQLRVCAPPEVGLAVTSSGVREVIVDGVRQSGSAWQSPGYLSAEHRTDLRVSLTFGSVEINPIGGCL